MEIRYKTIGVAGAGAMGRGIAQIAAQAGSTVWLYDTQPAAVQRAIQDLGAQWDRLQEKGRMDAAAAADYVKQMKKDKRYQRDVY